MSTPTQDAAGLSLELRRAQARIEELERQVEAGREAERRYQLLYEAGRELSSSLDISDVCERLRLLIQGLTRCDGLVISSYDEGDDLIRCEYAWADGAIVDTSILPPVPLNREGKGMQSLVILSGEARIFSDIAARVEQRQGKFYRITADGKATEVPDGRKVGPECALMVPVKIADKVTGVVQVMSDEAGVYEQEHLSLLEAIVNQLSVALHNARLYQRARHEIDERIRAETSLAEAVTQLRTTEQAVRESEERARIAIRAGRVGVWSWDIRANKVEWSETVYEFHGLKPGEFDGTVEAFAKLVHPGDLKQVRASMEAAVREGEPYSLEFRTVRPDGEVRWLSTSAQIVRDDEQNPLVMLGATVDITDRHMAQARARVLLSIHDAFLRAADPHELVGAAVDALGRELRVSRSVYLRINADEGWMEGYKDYCVDCASLSGRHPFDAQQSRMLPLLAAGRPVAIADLATEPGFSDLYESTYDQLRIAALIAIPILRHGQLVGTLSVQSSVPRRWADGEISIVQEAAEQVWLAIQTLLAQEQVRQLNADLEMRVQERTAELQAANREMEGFTYSVSHDMRGPLRGIVANARMLEDDFAHSIPAEARRHLVRISSAANRMAQLIDDLLRLSRITRQELLWSEVDMTDLAEQVAHEIEVERPGRIRFEIEKGLTAYCDPILLKLAIHNLLGNAAKFSGDGGVVEFGARKSDHGTAFYVKDQGIGFDPEYRERIFLPFERLHRDDEYPGTGIGLANVRRAIERHGGSVWAESAIGEGATFWFTLPAKRSDSLVGPRGIANLV